MIVIIHVAVHCIASVALLFEARCFNNTLFTRVEWHIPCVSVILTGCWSVFCLCFIFKPIRKGKEVMKKQEFRHVFSPGFCTLCLNITELSRTSSLPSMAKGKVKVVTWSHLTSGSMTTWRWSTWTRVSGARVRSAWAPPAAAPTTTARWTTYRRTTRREVSLIQVFTFNSEVLYGHIYMYMSSKL